MSGSNQERPTSELAHWPDFLNAPWGKITEALRNVERNSREQIRLSLQAIELKKAGIGFIPAAETPGLIKEIFAGQHALFRGVMFEYLPEQGIEARWKEETRIRTNELSLLHEGKKSGCIFRCKGKGASESSNFSSRTIALFGEKRKPPIVVDLRSTSVPAVINVAVDRRNWLPIQSTCETNVIYRFEAGMWRIDQLVELYTAPEGHQIWGTSLQVLPDGKIDFRTSDPSFVGPDNSGHDWSMTAFSEYMLELFPVDTSITPRFNV